MCKGVFWGARVAQTHGRDAARSDWTIKENWPWPFRRWWISAPLWIGCVGHRSVRVF